MHMHTPKNIGSYPPAPWATRLRGVCSSPCLCILRYLGSPAAFSCECVGSPAILSLASCSLVAVGPLATP